MENETTELLPCPFCGGEACYDDAIYVNHNHQHWCFCPSCSIGTGNRDTKKESVEAWNTRQQPKVTPKMVEVGANRIMKMFDPDFGDGTKHYYDMSYACLTTALLIKDKK